ncbi:unnamed protein product [Strongylus vulgaris]|uniref:Uncharacterized protein n=1 Tax=Strongylus vulgaris TaxID=40348 RepID=A0A3P7JBZ6_STRVU|nr:unnamed protein product [Strongylus vulgaris]
MLRDPLRLSLYTFTLAMISHALTLEFLQQIKSKNDWNFLRAVTEVEKVNSDSLTKLRGLVKFNDRLEEAMHSYTQLCITESDYHSLQCQEFLVCPSCANTAQLYHKCYHMKYHLLKKCEDKLEVIGTQHPEYSPERTVEAARKCRVWLNKVLSDYMDIWKKIQNLDH